MIEMLENRTLFTTVAAADDAALLADAKTVKSDLVSIAASGRAELSALTEDVKSLPKSAAVTTLKTEVAAATKALVGEAKILVESGKLKQVFADAAGVNRHPTNTADQAKLKSALNAAITAGAAPASAIETVATAAAKTVEADFLAVITANPSDTKLMTDFAAGSALAAAGGGGGPTPPATLQTDLTTLINALA